MTNLFDGIDNIDWAGLKTSRDGSTAQAFPEHLRNMLTVDKDQYERAFESIQAMLLYYLEYWSEAAPYIIPYLLRLLDEDKFHFKAEFVQSLGLDGWLDELNMHFEYEEKVGISVREWYYNRVREIYYKAIEYVDKFIPFLKHERAFTRESAVIIICNFREKASETVPILVNYFEMENDLQTLGAMSIYISALIAKTEDNLNSKDISEFIEIYRQKRLRSGEIWRKCLSATSLANYLPHLIPNEVIEILEDIFHNHPETFRRYRYGIGVAVKALKTAGHTINIDVEVYRRRELLIEDIWQKCSSATWLAQHFPHLIPNEVIEILEDVYHNHPKIFSQKRYDIKMAVKALKTTGRAINIDL